MKDKAIQIGREIYEGMNMALKVVYFTCAVYGAYQIITKLPQLGKVLEIAQK